jgi:hypothetical protein
MTDREKLVWIANALESHGRTTGKSEYIGGRRFVFNDDGELVKIHEYGKKKSGKNRDDEEEETVDQVSATNIYHTSAFAALAKKDNPTRIT